MSDTFPIKFAVRIFLSPKKPIDPPPFKLNGCVLNIYLRRNITSMMTMIVETKADPTMAPIKTKGPAN